MSELKQEHHDIVEKYISDSREGKANHYMITVSRDGEYPARSIISYDNVVDAVQGYEMYQDAGFAKQYLTVSLFEPCGKINQKTLKRNQAGDPSFVRQNYIDVANALYSIKDKLEKEEYEILCIRIMSSFGRDNWRFDTERFLKMLEVDKKIEDYYPMI